MKTFEEAYKSAEKWVEKLREIDDKIKRWEFNLDKIKPSTRKYARRKRNGKKRIRELEYRSTEPDDYHDWNKHKNDKLFS